MKPIPLARVRLLGNGQNICGISAQTFTVPGQTAAGDQLVGTIDRITLLENAVLFERAGHRDVLIPINSIGPMTPIDDIRGELLGPGAPPKPELPPEPVRATRPVSVTATIPVARLRDDDGDELRPEAAVTLPADQATRRAVAIEPEETPVGGFKGQATATKSKHGHGKRKGPLE